MISHRHAEANHKDVPGYDPAQPDNHIVYLDANNLYGWSMSQSLPVQGFRWLEEEEMDLMKIAEISDDAEEGYILEVDLDYPQDLHDMHNEYPLAPEKVTVTEDILSPYAQDLLKDLGLAGTSMEKLVPNLRPKEKYVVHYRNPTLYRSLCIKLTKIIRVMAFEQRSWLKPYIDFEKDFFKLMNNAVFGKTMENLRKRMDVKLVNSQSRARKLTCKPSFHAFRIFCEDLVAIHLLKQRLYLNRPIYVGFAILDLSKTLMYDFHYRYVKSKYGSRS